MLGGSIVPPGATVEIITRDVSFAEGPAAGPDGAIYFSDIPTGPKPGRILRIDPRQGTVSVFREDSRKSNGLAFDPKGRLVLCEGADGGGRRISRLEPDGRLTAVAERYQNKRFNAPNDLTIDASGRLYFSDPKYLGSEPRELDHRSVFRVDPDGRVHLAVSQPDVEKPNGVELSPDGTVLYVADNNNEEVTRADGTKRPGAKLLLSFRVNNDGSVSGRRVLDTLAPESGIDGMCVDAQGRLFAAVRGRTTKGIQVYAPSGDRLEFIQTPDTPTNCCFGIGPEGNRLYITMDSCVGRIQTRTKGASSVTAPASR